MGFHTPLDRLPAPHLTHLPACPHALPPTLIHTHLPAPTPVYTHLPAHTPVHTHLPACPTATTPTYRWSVPCVGAAPSMSAQVACHPPPSAQQSRLPALLAEPPL